MLCLLSVIEGTRLGCPVHADVDLPAELYLPRGKHGVALGCLELYSVAESCTTIVL